MGRPSDELEYLKSLVAQLNEKITSLEAKAKATVKAKTPAQQLRTILIGPPGAGEAILYSLRRGGERGDEAYAFVVF